MLATEKGLKGNRKKEREETEGRKRTKWKNKKKIKTPKIIQDKISE